MVIAILLLLVGIKWKKIKAKKKTALLFSGLSSIFYTTKTFGSLAWNAGK